MWQSWRNLSRTRHIFIIMHNLNILYAFVSRCLSRGLKNGVIFFLPITMLSLDPYPRIAGDSHILFQPITAISSLLDLIGPLPQGRRLFGPTVLESRQPSRNLPIFSGWNRIPTWKKSERALLWDFQFSVLKFQVGGWKKIAETKIVFKRKWIDFLFLIDFYFI